MKGFYPYLTGAVGQFLDTLGEFCVFMSSFNN
jgi:hypothetical protein